MAEFAVAILTGGRSVRMGREKALLRIGGVPLVRRVADAAVEAGAERVVAVGGVAAPFEALGIEVVADPHEGSGPLGGIVTALAALADHPTVVVLSCDLAAPSARAIRTVADALGRADVAVPRARGHLEPLHAAWRTGAAPAVAGLFASGERSVREAIGRLESVVVDGVGADVLTGLNTPGEVIGHVVGQNRGMSDVPEIGVEELVRRREAGALVLDVRQPAEYEAAHVPGAILVPLDQLAARQEEIPRDEPLLVICRSGARSAAAAGALIAAGYDATNVAGGMLAWIDAGHPVGEGPAAG
jgi:phage shock protein E